MPVKFMKYNYDYNKNLIGATYRYRNHYYSINFPDDFDKAKFKQPERDYNRFLRVQHKKEQNRIDKQLDQPKDVDFKPYQYEGSAQEGFDLFWKYCDDN